MFYYTILISVRKPPGTSEGSSGLLWKNLKQIHKNRYDISKVKKPFITIMDTEPYFLLLFQREANFGNS